MGCNSGCELGGLWEYILAGDMVGFWQSILCTVLNWISGLVEGLLD